MSGDITEAKVVLRWLAMDEGTQRLSAPVPNGALFASFQSYMWTATRHVCSICLNAPLDPVHGQRHPPPSPPSPLPNSDLRDARGIRATANHIGHRHSAHANVRLLVLLRAVLGRGGVSR